MEMAMVQRGWSCLGQEKEERKRKEKEEVINYFKVKR